MISIDVDVDLDSEIGYKVNEGVMKYLETGADRGFAEYIERVPVDRGNLQQNSYSPEREGNRVRYGTRDVPYARAIDEGTGPFQPPVQPLVEWARRVAGDPGLGYYVALHKIPEEGIDAQPFSDPAKQMQKSWYASHSPKRFLDRQFR